jgi:hypothetical protein
MIAPMREILVLAGGVLFLSSTTAYVYVKLVMKPRLDDSDLYHEFEDRDPRLIRYNQYSRFAIAGATIGALLLFLGTA